MSPDKGFTLIELLIVIGILAILATVVIVVINPTELIKQARDSTRLSDLGTLNTGLQVAQTQSISFFGTSSIVYVSIFDSTSTCANLGLPTLLSGWSYNCAPSSTLTKVDGSGWVPVNFTQMTIGVPFSNLPIDPINTTSSGNYYTYVAGGSWELTALTESDKYLPKAINDGDSYPGVYSLRTSASTLTPGTRDKGMVGYWKFDEGSGSNAYDTSGNGNNGSVANAIWVTGKLGGGLSFSSTNDDYVAVAASNSLNFGNYLTIVVWIKANDLAGRSPIFSTRACGNPGSFQLEVGVTANGINTVGVTTPGNYNLQTSNDVISTGTWYHIAYIRKGTSVGDQEAYVNGIKQTLAIENNVAFIDNNCNKYIGANAPANNAYDGLIDDVRIYNRALSGAEISAIYNATK